jgi:hypothetical protein
MRAFFAFAFALLSLSLSEAAQAQEAIRSRSVRIIEGDPSPALAETPTPAPATLPILSESPNPADNFAGLKVEILPGPEVAIGDPMQVRVTTEKPGYLVIVDIDSSGELTQIYPNTQSLASPQGSTPTANLLTRGKPRFIPDPKEKTNFQFIAAAPTGVGMVVAILSDKPVQMIDLPNVPAALAGRAPALEYVQETTRSLKILPATDRDRIQEPKWSFATKFYVIK